MSNFFKWGSNDGREFNNLGVLLEGLQSRDRSIQDAAVKYVIKHYRRSVKGFLAWKGCKDEKVCEELFILSLEKMIDPKTSLTDEGAEFETIINTFAKNQWLSWLKSRSNTTEIPESWLLSGEDGEDTDGATKIEVLGRNGGVFDREGPDEEADAILLVRQALKLLRRRHCREIFELKYYHDLTQAEIAEELKLVRETVTNLKGKCIEDLKAILRDLGMRMPNIEVHLKDIGKKR
ncbi:MAG: RNA polymerase sigma factor [Dyadobacter fermentans]